MNPFRAPEALPRRPWLRLALGLAGLTLLAWVARHIEWHEFRMVLLNLRWPWLLAGMLLGCAAMGARAVRLTWILAAPSGFTKVWRAMALGYLGQAVLPLGAGELLKIGALQGMLRIPAAGAAAGAFLDRLFDLLGLAVLLGILALAGVTVQFREGSLRMGLILLTSLVLALGAILILRSRILARGDSRARRLVEQIASVLDGLRRPAHLARLLAAQGAVSVLDVSATYVALHAFPFGPGLALIHSVKLSAFLMLGAALPLLPGGAGTLQVASLLALRPAGVSTSGAFAFSLVAQGTGLLLYGVMGLAVAFWPVSRPGGTA